MPLRSGASPPSCTQSKRYTFVMAISSGTDYVFAPHVDVVIEKCCLLGTGKYFYLIPDRKHIDKGWLADVLSSTYTVETITFGDSSPREIISALVVHDDTTLDSIHALMLDLKTKLDVVQIIEIASVKKLKVKAGLFGGSIVFVPEGARGYTPFVTGIPKPNKKPFEAFYAPIIAQMNS